MKSNRVGIFGTAGMAREACDVALALGLSPVLVSKDASDIGFLDFDTIPETNIQHYLDMPYVIGIGECGLRAKIAARYGKKISFTNLIHPSATFGDRQIEKIRNQKGVIICAGVRFTHNIEVGNFSIFNLNATISHDVVIGDFVTISPQACILGNVEVREGTWIGAAAVVNQGCEISKRIIGRNTIIGSGAVVLDNCDSDATYVGVPARRIS